MQTDSLTLRIHDDIRVTVPNNLSHLTPFVLLEQEDWFEDEIHFVRTLLTPGDRVVDIGANYGLYTLSMAKQVGPEGRIWAFEPASTTASFLKQSVADNAFDQVTVIQAALSDHAGEARLNLHFNPEMNTLNEDEWTADATSEAVPLMTLDAAAEEHGFNDLTFLKLDAEGEECRILTGGTTTLAAPGPLVMYELRHGTQVNLPLIEQFVGMGYETYRLLPGLGVLVPFNPGTENIRQLNLFGATRERAQILAAQGLLALADAPPPSEDVTAGSWREFLSDKPYATDALARWSDDSATCGVLDLYTAAHDPRRSPGERHHRLRQALEQMTELIKIESTVWRLMTLVRLQTEFTGRGSISEPLVQLFNLAYKRPAAPAEEPFLPAYPRYDQVDPSGRDAYWAAAVATEAYVNGEYSVYFFAPNTLAGLDMFDKLGFPSPRITRQRQLADLLSRKQTNIIADPQLAQYSPENRNPGYWSR